MDLKVDTEVLGKILPPFSGNFQRNTGVYLQVHMALQPRTLTLIRSVQKETQPMENAYVIITQCFPVSVIIKYKKGVHSSRKNIHVQSYIRNQRYKTTTEESEKK
jgi:hypothetical protein